MFVIDTNVLVRILLEEPGSSVQVKLARAFAKKQAKLFVPQIVQVELVWVLSGTYEVAKNEIITVLEHLANNEAFLLQNEDQFLEALHLLKTSNVDFSDCLILAESQNAGYSVVTFDKKFSKLPKVKVLTE